MDGRHGKPLLDPSADSVRTVGRLAVQEPGVGSSLGERLAGRAQDKRDAGQHECDPATLRIGKKMHYRRAPAPPAHFRTHDMEYAAQHAAVLDANVAPSVGQQMRLDPPELLICESEKIAMSIGLLPETVKSQRLTHTTRFMETDPSIAIDHTYLHRGVCETGAEIARSASLLL